MTENAKFAKETHEFLNSIRMVATRIKQRVERLEEMEKQIVKHDEDLGMQFHQAKPNVNILEDAVQTIEDNANHLLSASKKTGEYEKLLTQEFRKAKSKIKKDFDDLMQEVEDIAKSN